MMIYDSNTTYFFRDTTKLVSSFQCRYMHSLGMAVLVGYGLVGLQRGVRVRAREVSGGRHELSYAVPGAHLQRAGPRHRPALGPHALF